MKPILVLTSLLLLSSCATVELSAAGKQVKTISSGDAKACKYIGITRAFTESAIASEIIVRNDAAKQGGNCLVQTSKITRADWYEVVAEVYKCD